MHSPIIYLIADKDNNKSNSKNILSKNMIIPDDDEIVDAIPECDWAVANTKDTENWHRNDWTKEYKEILSDSPYYTLNDNNGDLSITISKEHVFNWYKRIIEVQTIYNEALQVKLDNQELFSDTPIPDSNIKEANDYDDMIKGESGGIKFFIFEEFDDEMYPEQLCSLKGLIKYAHHHFYFNKDDSTDMITFHVSKNVSGDYHY